MTGQLALFPMSAAAAAVRPWRSPLGCRFGATATSAAPAPTPDPADLVWLVDPGQLALPPAPTERRAVCEHCRQIIAEVETASALLWVHPDGDTRCPIGGYATPVQVAAAASRSAHAGAA
jgi:hypothetical protein